MQVKLADTAGFCFGVKRAIEMIYDLPYEDKRCCTLGPIIHNKVMVKDLEKKNIYAVGNLEETKDYDIVVIRSHGVSKLVFDELRSMGKTVVDATCPFVSKIHKIVYEQSKEGKTILIAGDGHHPEVQGIIGHSLTECYTFKDDKELETALSIIQDKNNKGYCLVSQTTFDIELWQKFVKILKKVYTKLDIFDTICNATSLRQSEADRLSASCDAMLVIGDRGSSNTQKLYNIASRNCKKTFLIETLDDLRPEDLDGCTAVGVTAGASTPDTIIKEVVDSL